MMKRINVYLDEDLWLSFRKQCLEQRASASKVLAGLLTQFLKDTEAFSLGHIPHVQERASRGPRSRKS